MKLLILGNSDTSGLFTTGQTWSQLLVQGLRDRGIDVEFQESGFVVLSPASAAHAENKVRDFEPDLVILPVGTAMFTVGFVYKRVETFFGKRAARWYRRAEHGFDGKTRDRGSLRGRANAGARQAIRRMVGTQTMSTQAAVTDGFHHNAYGHELLGNYVAAQLLATVAAPA